LYRRVDEEAVRKHQHAAAEGEGERAQPRVSEKAAKHVDLPWTSFPELILLCFFARLRGAGVALGMD
jgi:hypothetical protein